MVILSFISGTVVAFLLLSKAVPVLQSVTGSSFIAYWIILFPSAFLGCVVARIVVSWPFRNER